MNKDTFCIMPFINVYLERDGDYVACGHSYSVNQKNSNINTHTVEQAWNDEYYSKLRSDLLNGIKNENCMTCWTKEARNIPSARQQLNEGYKDLISTIDNPKPIMLGIKSDNLCNLKCITCNSYQSSQHEREVEEMREQNVSLPKWIIRMEELNRGNFYTTDYIIENVDSLLKNKVKLEIQGGEPLISPITNKLFDYCIEKGYTDLEMQITINLTSLTDKMLDKLSKFPNLDLWISWDHVDNEKFHFIRYPADYPTFIKNLIKLKKVHNSLGISYTNSIFNCMDIKVIFDTIEQIGIEHSIHWKDVMFRNMQQPDYFSVRYLDNELKKQAISCLYALTDTNNTLLKPMFMNELKYYPQSIMETPEDYNSVIVERTRALELYDKFRRTDYKRLFPYV